MEELCPTGKITESHKTLSPCKNGKKHGCGPIYFNEVFDCCFRNVIGSMNADTDHIVQVYTLVKEP